MPLVFERSLKIATGMTLPLALLALGGGFSLEKLRGDLVKAALSSCVKTIWMPIVKPAAFGRMLQLRKRTTTHRWFLLGYILTMMFITPFCVLCISIYSRYRYQNTMGHEGTHK